MLKIDKVLFPTDFSDHAEAALPWALRLAEKHGAELHLLHALVLHAADEAQVEARYEELADEARAELRAMAEDGPVSTVRLVPAVRKGVAPAPLILEYASEEDVDLIVMGSHGRRGLRRLLLGSVAEEIVRTASCAVLTVRGVEGREHDVPSLDRILAPTDFSKHARAGVEAAAGLSAAFGSELHLLHVVEQAVYPDFYFPVSVPAWDLPELRQRAAERLEELAGEVRSGAGAGVETRVEVVIGRAAAEIAEHAEEIDADLIVIASHGIHGLERVLLGSVAERVGRQARRSVLTVKAFGKRLAADEEDSAEPSETRPAKGGR